MRFYVNKVAIRVVQFLFPLALIVFQRSEKVRNLVEHTLGIASRQPASGPHEGQGVTRINQGSFFSEQCAVGLLPNVTIVIPIYKAFEVSKACIESVLLTLPDFATLLIIDDASNESRITEFLDGLEMNPKVRIQRNDVNLGYTKNVNSAFRMAGRTDVILLNSDTVVADRWVENLRYSALSSSNVATVTPISDNSGVFSVPSVWGSNLHPTIRDNDDLARLVGRAGLGIPIQVPTGNGFCMYVRRGALDVLVGYDDESFPRGYGEENDFCLRAQNAGWTNLVTDKVFVSHKGSQSFGSEKQDLMKSGSKALLEKYPDYSVLVTRFHESDFAQLRERVRVVWESEIEEKPKPRLLLVNPISNGGLAETSRDLVEGLIDEMEIFFLVGNRTSVTFGKLSASGKEVIFARDYESPLDARLHTSVEYDSMIASLIFKHSIDNVHVEHLAWQSLNIFSVCQALGVRVTFTAHDFYSLCASHHLLDGNGQSCGGRCTSGSTPCSQGLWPNVQFPQLKNVQVLSWRAKMMAALANANAIIAPSEFVKNRLLEFSQDIKPHLISVIPHGRNLQICSPMSDIQFPNEPLRILIPGSIGPHKGSKTIKSLIELDRGSGKMEFHFLGTVDANLLGLGIQHGAYRRSEFSQRVGSIKPHLGLILSTAEETFSHTLTECWAAGLPVVGLAQGAVGERLKESEAGWLVSKNASPADIYEQLLAIHANPLLLQRARGATEAWQKSFPEELNASSWARATRLVISGGKQ